MAVPVPNLTDDNESMLKAMSYAAETAERVDTIVEDVLGATNAIDAEKIVYLRVKDIVRALDTLDGICDDAWNGNHLTNSVDVMAVLDATYDRARLLRQAIREMLVSL